MNTMPRNPAHAPGPPPSIPNIQQPPPQFQANPLTGPPFAQPPGTVSPLPTPSSSVPPPVRPLQTPHASGGWPSSQSQRPPQASLTFMSMRPPISVSPVGGTPPRGSVALVPPSDVPTDYHSQPPVANFGPSATLLSRPPGGAQSFPPQGPSSIQVPPFPTGASAQSSYPLPMQMRPMMSAPDTMRGQQPPLSQVGPTPGMVPSSVGYSRLPASAPASTSCSQASIGTLRPPHPTAGDFTFRPVVAPLRTPDFGSSAGQMGIHGNIHPGLPQVPFFRPANQTPNVAVQGFQRPLDGRPIGQPRMHGPSPHFPGAFPRNPSSHQLPVGFRVIPAAIQPGGQMISPPMLAPSNVPSFLPSRPFQFMPLPQQNQIANTNRQGDNSGGPIYDPFAPTAAASGGKKTDGDPEYEDLMASVGVK
uniref:Uncharacterized protein n=1 Tax=Arundo donax TaxID=35708 RepID=A0A0A9ER44_ARUDO